MANVLVNESTLQGIASAIREKNGLSETYKPAQMISAIQEISTGQGDTAMTDFIEGKFSSYKNNIASFVASGVFGKSASLTSIELTNCKTISSAAFWSCSNLSFASFPQVTTVGYQAFDHCYNLTEINLQSATEIGGCAFDSCRKLSQVNLPAATVIRSSAFIRCSSLFTVRLPKVISIYGHAFSNCSILTNLYLYNSSKANLLSAAFYGTSLYLGYGHIYVPESLYSSYKTATNWTTMSKAFLSIPSTITGISASLNTTSMYYLHDGNDQLDTLKYPLNVFLINPSSSYYQIYDYDLSASFPLSIGSNTITINSREQSTSVSTNAIWGYDNFNTFVSTGSDFINTGKKFGVGKYTIAIKFRIKSLPSSSGGYKTIIGNLDSNVGGGISGTNLLLSSESLWGLGIGWTAGKNVVTTSSVLLMVITFNFTDQYHVDTSTYVKNYSTGDISNYSMSYSYSSQEENYFAKNIYIGDQESSDSSYYNCGFSGDVYKVIIQQGEWSEEKRNTFLGDIYS